MAVSVPIAAAVIAAGTTVYTVNRQKAAAEDAGNQANAIAALERDKPDVLILDLHLRQGTGFGVLRGMRADAPRPTTLILTTYDLPEYRREAQALGAKVFLDKSRDYNRLPQLLLDLLAEKMHDRDP